MELKEDRCGTNQNQYEIRMNIAMRMKGSGNKKKNRKQSMTICGLLLHGRRGSNSRHPVLETGALPTEAAVVERGFGGSLPAFVAAFLREKKLSPQEADELRRMLDESEGQNYKSD